MYRKFNQSTITPEKFELPFEGKLSPENRWVIMAELIPWSEFNDGVFSRKNRLKFG